MKALQVLIYLSLIFLISCKNTNSEETPKEQLVLQDSILTTDSNIIEIYVWVDKLRLRKTPDTKSEILQELYIPDGSCISLRRPDLSLYS